MTLELEHLTKRYVETTALDDVTITLTPGIYGLLGANGAGKSTLMNLITDNVKRDGGTIRFDGEDILSLGDKFRSKLGYMPQQQGVYEQMTAESFVSYIGRLKGLKGKELRAQVDKVLGLVNLSGVRHKKVGGFSGGMRQRVLLAQALLGDPKVLLLDEPTAGLDPSGSARILDNIRTYHEEKNACVILVSHSMEEVAREAGRLVVIHKGTIPFSGPPEEVFAHGPELEAMGLGVPAMTRVFARLRSMGVDVPPSVYTIPQAREAVLAALHRKEGV